MLDKGEMGEHASLRRIYIFACQASQVVPTVGNR